MVFIKAGPAEILRSSQKDEFVVTRLQNLVEDAYLRWIGPRGLIKHKGSLQKLGQLIYYGSTTLCGLQTLGEEYTGILQVNEKFDAIPSFLQRSTMVTLHCFGQKAAELFLNVLEKNIRSSEEIKPQAKFVILKWIALVRALLPSFVLLHKAVFYCCWGTYHMSKRITNINYVLIRYWLRDRKSLFGFRILGGITFANFVLFTIQTLHDFWKRTDELFPVREEVQPVATVKNSYDKKCAMCLCPLNEPTATMCGHVFCWNCINEWVQAQEKCPNCREVVLHSRLIPLMNYTTQNSSYRKRIFGTVNSTVNGLLSMSPIKF